jgi:DNA-binding transcriptional ArsR family regulator
MKSLKERRKTQSELAKELHLAPSTVSEHLEKMLEAGLVLKRKDHHKWIYYELTEKGLAIVSPQKTSMFVFAISLTLFAAAFCYILLTPNLSAAQSYGEKIMAAPTAAGSTPEAVQSQDYILVSLFGGGIIMLLLSAYYRFRK